MEPKEHYPISGFPKYVIEAKGDDIQVISYHYSKVGKYRALNENENCEFGLTLFNNGRKKFYTVADLRHVVNVEKAKAAVKKVSKVNRTSVGGTVQTGDWIVGSVTKVGGMFSVSSAPARHPTKESAKGEAARLAAVDKNKKFVVLKIEAMASVQEVNWE